jgi:hypothetical protein
MRIFSSAEKPACRPPDLFHDLFRRFLPRPGFLAHLRSLKGYDEPEILVNLTSFASDILGGAVAGERPQNPWAAEPVRERGSSPAVPSNPNSRLGRRRLAGGGRQSRAGARLRPGARQTSQERPN